MAGHIALKQINASLQDGAHRSILVWGNASVGSSTTTRYLTPGYTDSTAQSSTIQIRIPSAGTLKNLYVRHNTTAGNGNNIVYSVRVNGVASAIVVTLASTSANGTDSSNTQAVVAGDLVDIEVTKAATIAGSPSDITATLEVAA